MASSKAIRAIFFAAIVSCALAHSFLLDPPADWHNKNKAECRIGGPPGFTGDNCPGPCIDERSYFYKNDAAVTRWRRGQKVTIRWARNNHRHGFVRLSLVSKEHRMDKTEHAKGAFHYTCYESNRKVCNGDKYHCGTDMYIYETYVTVPTHLKNGRYVLGWSWYGAFDRESKQNRFVFGDYYSCAHIEIVGDDKPTGRPRKLFVTDSKHKGTCRSVTNKLGRCWKEPCPRGGNLSPAEMLPPGFKGVGFKDGKDDDDDDSEPTPHESDESDNGPASPEPVVPRAKVGAPVPIDKCKCASGRRSLSHGLTDMRVLRLKRDGQEDVSTGCLCRYTSIGLSNYKHGLTIIAETKGSVGAVRFFQNDQLIQTEVKVKYALAGNNGAIYHQWYPPAVDKVVNIRVEVLDENMEAIDTRSFRVIVRN